MKALKKKNRYEKVAPLPKGYASLSEANKMKDTDTKYRKSYKKLADLLQDGWKFCGKGEYRKALSEREKVAKKSEEKKAK